MAINKAGGPNFLHQINRTVTNHANTVNAQEARQSMMTGGAGKLAEQNKKNQTTKTPGEQVKLSNAAMLARAKETEAAEDADAQNRANVADEAAVQNRGKRGLGGKDEDDLVPRRTVVLVQVFHHCDTGQARQVLADLVWPGLLRRFLVENCHGAPPFASSAAKHI